MSLSAEVDERSASFPNLILAHVVTSRSFLRTASLVLFFAVWQAAAMSGAFTPVLLPAPTAVLAATWHMLNDGVLLPNIAVSMARIFVGFIVATLIGVPLGIAAGWSEYTRNLIEPVIELFRPIPVLAMLPMATLWFGIGETSKIFLITYGTFFPIFLNTLVGVAYVDPVLVQAAESLGASRKTIFLRVILMGAMPDIASGLKLGVGFSFLTLVAAEMIASQSGLGYLIMDTQLTFRTSETLSATLALGVLGFASSALVGVVESHLLRWKKGLGALRNA